MVAVEQRVVRPAFLDERQLPREVHAVAQPAAQTLTEERWHLVRGVTGEKDVPDPHLRRNRGVESIDGTSFDGGIVGGDPRTEELGQACGCVEIYSAFVGTHLELPSVPGREPRHQGDDPPWVADLLGEGLETGVPAHPDVDHDPLLVEVEVGEPDAQSLAGRR